MWSIVSLVLFNMYIRSVIESLIKSDLACHVHGVYIGCLVYADDIILMSASVAHLQRMLDFCNVRVILQVNGRGQLTPLTTPTPLNRQSPNIAYVITSTISAHMAYLVKIAPGLRVI